MSTIQPYTIQESLPGFCPVEQVIDVMAGADVAARGAVFTRPEVVGFILDLIGYTGNQPLHRFRLLEPAMGEGSFLLSAIDRLFLAYDRVTSRGNHTRNNVVADLGDCIRAVELHHHSYEQVCAHVRSILRRKGLTGAQADALCERWLIRGDFLLLSFGSSFTHVIGNPPYVRSEMIRSDLMAEYRRRYRTIFDRADLYVPFFERSLDLLEQNGVLGFICADRWMKNRYGGPLRRYVATGFHLRHFVDMVGTNAFESDVVAYPGIFVIAREPAGPTRVARAPALDDAALAALAGVMTARTLVAGHGVSEFGNVTDDSRPWMLGGSGELEVIRRIEADFPSLEAADCKVGIGVATGADRVFIDAFERLDVEPDRKLPLVMTDDIVSGIVAWRGLGVVNPFGDDGKLVPLRNYPRLAAYLHRHEAAIRARHVSKRNSNGWYRTIDRIHPALTARPKLLIPDIKGWAHIVHEPGKLYPHHNLYYITSDRWDLHALQAVLMSDVTRSFIALYSTRMRGGYLRFQAQYLRRLRLPRWEHISAALRSDLVQAGKARNLIAGNEAVAALYRLTRAERMALQPAQDIARAP